MTALNATDAINIAFYSALHGDSTLIGIAIGGVSQGLSPFSDNFPYCCYQYMGGAGYTYSFTERIINDMFYVVKGVSQDDGGIAAGLIAARSDIVLTDSHSLTPGAGWSVMYCRREADIDMEETMGDHIFYHRGGRYRVVIQPA